MQVQLPGYVNNINVFMIAMNSFQHVSISLIFTRIESCMLDTVARLLASNVMRKLVVMMLHNCSWYWWHFV